MSTFGQKIRTCFMEYVKSTSLRKRLLHVYVGGIVIDNISGNYQTGCNSLKEYEKKYQDSTDYEAVRAYIRADLCQHFWETYANSFVFPIRLITNSMIYVIWKLDHKFKLFD